MGRERKSGTWNQASGLQSDANQPGRRQAKRRWRWEQRLAQSCHCLLPTQQPRGDVGGQCRGSHFANPPPPGATFPRSNTPSTNPPGMQAFPWKENRLNNSCYFFPCRAQHYVLF